MSGLGLPEWLVKPLAVFLIDFLMAGDNALVIALVCMSLPRRSRQLVLLLGTAGAIVLRVTLASIAGSILALPGLKLAGGALLAMLALNLVLRDTRRHTAAPPMDERHDVLAAALLVTLLDVLMSLDNVVALAAVAGDSLPYLAIGLLFSVSILMFGSALVANLLARFPDLSRFGAAVLGWVAGQLLVSDALLHDSIATQAPVLPLLVPALAATYVYLLGGNVPAPAFVPLPAPRRARPAARERKTLAPNVVTPQPPPALEEQPGTEKREPDPVERRDLIILLSLFAVAAVVMGVAALIGGDMLH